MLAEEQVACGKDERSKSLTWGSNKKTGVGFILCVVGLDGWIGPGEGV